VLEELRSDYQNAYDLLHELRPPDAKSLDFRRKELSLAEQIARKNPSDPSALRNLATSFRDMADALLAFNRDKEAFSVFSELRETLDKLVAISHNLADLESLPPLYHSLGYEMAERGKLPEAIALERKVVVISSKLTHADPKDTHARFWFAVGNADLAAMLATIPQRAEASRAASTAIVVIGKLASEQPENQGFHVAEGELLEEAGDVFLQQGQNNRALLCYRESVSEFEKLRSGDPQNTAWPLYLATAYNSLGWALLKLGDNQGAEHAYRKAMALQQAGTSQENDWETYYAAANTYAGLGNSAAARAANRSAKLAKQRDEWRAALSWYELSDSIWRKVKRPCFPTEDAFLACVPPAEVSRRIKECQRMLQQLSLKGR
jgi:tetratricopeptide (TPR) repeat protein